MIGCALLASIAFSGGGQAAAPRRVEDCAFKYGLAERRLKPATGRAACDRGVAVFVGDVVIASAEAPRTTTSEIKGVCRREEQESYRCGPFSVFNCTRTKNVDTPRTHNLPEAVEPSVYFHANSATAAEPLGTLRLGATKGFVVPEDGRIRLAPIDVTKLYERAEEQRRKLCAPNESLLPGSSVKHWFEADKPSARLVVCRGGVDDSDETCEELER
ncbi:hypothetical protein [Sorangium cellulosum]|nr:hypothetical protein [Sorangium cellulosum]AGP37451.1 hypothetical protein SCE1572_24940 [Sorangium cellulosum So0157-2]